MNIKGLSRHFSNQYGMSVVEVLISTAILAMIFMAVAYATTLSLSGTKQVQNRILASRYADELEEWMRGEKESGWSTFVARSGADPGITYCFNDSTISWPTAGGCGTTFGLFGRFRREVVLVGTDSQVNVEISVQWKDGSQTYTVPIDTVFTLWD